MDNNNDRCRPPPSASEQDLDIWSRIISKRRKEWLKMNQEDLEKEMGLDALMKKGMDIPTFREKAKLKPHDKLEWLLQHHLCRSLDEKEKHSKRRYSWNLVQSILSKIDELSSTSMDNEFQNPQRAIGAVDTAASTVNLFQPIREGASSKEITSNVYEDTTDRRRDKLDGLKEGKRSDHHQQPQPQPTQPQKSNTGERTTATTSTSTTTTTLLRPTPRPTVSPITTPTENEKDPPTGLDAGNAKKQNNGNRNKNDSGITILGATVNAKAAFVPPVSANRKANQSTPSQYKKRQEKTPPQQQQKQKPLVRELPTLVRPTVKSPPPPKHIKFQADVSTPLFSCALDQRSEIMVRYKLQYLSQKTKTESDQDIYERFSKWDPYWKIHYGFLDRTSKVEKVEHLGIPVGEAPKTAIELNFALDARDAFLVTTWGKACDRKASDGEARFILRMLPLSNPMLQKPPKRADTHLWPRGTFVQINDRLIHLRQRKQQSHDSSKWYGMSHCLDVTPFVSKPTAKNKIQICCIDSEPYIACLAICYYKLPYPSVYQTIYNTYLQRLSHDESVGKAIGIVNDKKLVVLDDDDSMDGNGVDSSNAMDNASIVFSLNCPLSRKLMKTPVRGRTCEHWQCFDLQNFLQTNEPVYGQRWKCGVCENFVSPEDLQECGLYLTVLNQYRNQANLHRDRVQFCSDGTWTLMDENKKRYSVKRSSSSGIANEPPSSRHRLNPSGTTNNPAPPPPDHEIVVLD